TGAIIGGYLGTLLLGAFFLSIGIFFSGFCRDQIVAFVVTLLVCFILFLLGTNFIASYIDGFVPGLGSMLSAILGFMDHYTTFTRGVIDVADLLFFVAWTVLFIVLNIMFIEVRNRPGARFTFGSALVLCAGIGLALNWLVNDTSLGRKDLTQDQIYTVSPATQKILAGLDSQVHVKLYITPVGEMPTVLKQLERDITDKLAELQIESGGKLDFTPVYLKAANVLADQADLLGGPDSEKKEKTESEAIEKRMFDKGVKPFMVQAMVDEEVTQKPVYSTIGIGFKAGEEELIPNIMPEMVPELEYRIASIVHKMTRKDPPRVALVAPKEAVNIPPQMRQLYAQMGQAIPEQEDPYEYVQQILEYEKYKVERVDLTQTSKLPDEYDTLVVINPRELNERQKWEINRALVSGKSVILAVQNYTWDYRPLPDGRLSVSKNDENPGINDLIKNYGVEVDEDFLMDKNQVTLSVRGGNDLLSALTGGQPYKLPTQMLINNSTMDKETSITSRLSTIFYLWGTALKLNEDEMKKLGLTSKVLITSTDGAWKTPPTPSLTQAAITPSPTGEKYPLMAMISGTFPDAFKDKPRPAWPPAEPAMPGMPPPPPADDEGPAPAITPAPGKLIVMGCSQMFHKNFMQAGNLDLFLNCVDGVTLGDDLVSIRSRKPIDRTIDKPSDNQRRVWKFVNYALMNGGIAIAGVAIAAARRRSRNAYTMSYAANRGE
ncbi:MAG: GldG family protein, partial [Candidatus Hydrogenedentes bacterium]|nr:GldG family protein [Candidatus Hydrogenedentota bacterium]